MSIALNGITVGDTHHVHILRDGTMTASIFRTKDQQPWRASDRLHGSDAILKVPNIQGMHGLFRSVLQDRMARSHESRYPYPTILPRIPDCYGPYDHRRRADIVICQVMLDSNLTLLARISGQVLYDFLIRERRHHWRCWRTTSTLLHVSLGQDPEALKRAITRPLTASRSSTAGRVNPISCCGSRSRRTPTA
jgi:hypothetical protein